MANRTRSRVAYTAQGRSGVATQNSWTYRTATVLSETCEDTVGFRDTANYFDLQRSTKDPYILNTVNPRPDRLACYAYPSDDHQRPLQSVAVDKPLIDNSMWVKLVAQTNPSTPDIQLPVSLSELRELPSLIQSFGRNAFRAAADGNLRWQFGIKPMVQDLRTLFSFVQQVNNRLRQLEQMRKNGGVSKRLRLGMQSNSVSSGPIVIHSGEGIIRAKIETRRSVTTWGSVYWTPSSAISAASKDELRRIAKLLTLGLHRSNMSLNVWNALPWSWLIDWFFNLSNALAAGNRIAAHPHRMCIMQTDESIERRPITSKSSTISVTGTGTYITVRKRRFVNPPPILLPGFLPALSRRQVSILASLSVVKTLRK